MCSEVGCPNFTTSTRCDDCRREHERARGGNAERGYGAEHQRAKRDPAYINATHCATCGQPFTDTNPKTAGHDVALRNGGGTVIHPECRACNYGWRKTGT